MANRYKACFQYSSDDHYHWISGIKAGGYATDPGYVAKIEKVIKDYGLERFDKQAIAEAYQQGIQIGYARNGESPVSGVKSQPIPETTVLLPENSRYSFPIQAEVMTVTSPFGHRTAPKAGASTEHMGLDIRAGTLSTNVLVAVGSNRYDAHRLNIGNSSLTLESLYLPFDTIYGDALVDLNTNLITSNRLYVRSDEFGAKADLISTMLNL